MFRFIVFIATISTAFAYDYTAQVQVHNESDAIQVVAHIKNLKGDWVKVFLPFTKFIHSSGEVVFANEKGEVVFDHPQTEYKVSLSSRFFDLKLNHRMPVAQMIFEGEINLNDHFSLADISVRANLDIARIFALENLVDEARTDWFYKSVPVILDYGPGCNAAWNGDEILIFTGDDTCLAPGLSADIVIHEYGHGVLANLASRSIYSLDFAEAFADSFMVMITRDEKIAEGFYPSKPIGYLRELSHDYVWPLDWRGVYTGSLIFSSIIWDAISELHKLMGEPAFVLVTKVLFSIPVKGYDPEKLNISFQAQSFFNLLVEVPSVAENSTLLCYLSNLFSARGIPDIKNYCGTQESEREDLPLPQLELAVGAGAIQDLAQFEQEFVVKVADIKRVKVELAIEHSFADDLMIFFELSSGRTIPIFRGLEEIRIPKVIEVLDFPSEYEGVVKLVIRDHSAGYAGSIQAGKLSFY